MNHSCKVFDLLKHWARLHDRYARGKLEGAKYFRLSDKIKSKIDACYLTDCELSKLRRAGY